RSNFFWLQSRFPENVTGTDDSVLRVGASLAFKAQSFFEIEGDHRGLGELEHEIAQCANGNLRGDLPPLFFRHFGMAGVHFFLGSGNERVYQVIGLYAESFTA